MKTRIGLLVLLSFAMSCTEIAQFPDPDLEVLSFNSFEQFQNITKGISSMPQVELSDWEKSNSFKSYRSVLAEADAEWATVDDEAKEAAFQEKYSDVLSIHDGALVPHIKVVMYQSIINRKGIYRTGDHFHKVIGNFIVSVNKEDYHKLGSLTTVDGMVPEANGARVFKYMTDDVSIASAGRTKASCTSVNGHYEAEYYYNPANCKDDRKAFISGDPYISLFTGYGDFNGTTRYGDFYQWAFEFRVWAQRRYAITCNFNGYANPLQWRSITFRWPGAHVFGYASDWSQFYFQLYTVNVPNWSSGGGELTSYAADYPYGDVVFNTTTATYVPGGGPPINDYYLYAEGKSQGIGDNWAIILCHITW